jgi:hypothetical protein
MAASAYTQNWISDWFKGVTAPDAPADEYAQLYVGNPNASGVAVTAFSSPRVAITWGSDTAGSMAAAEIDWGVATAAVADVDYIATFDAAAAGNLLRYELLTNGPIDIADGAPVSYAAGALISAIT